MGSSCPVHPAGDAGARIGWRQDFMINSHAANRRLRWEASLAGRIEGREAPRFENRTSRISTKEIASLLVVHMSEGPLTLA
jgi:hypothetical protein